MVPKVNGKEKGGEFLGEIIWSLNKGGNYWTETNIWYETGKKKKADICSENRKGNMWSEV